MRTEYKCLSDRQGVIMWEVLACNVKEHVCIWSSKRCMAVETAADVFMVLVWISMCGSDAIDATF